MPPAFSLKNATFSYGAERPEAGISNVTLEGFAGNVILLAGESGCGKTTITKLANGLIPHYSEGALSGRVEVCGLDTPSVELYQISQHVGSVFQNPRSQFFTTDTTSELAFSCENQGIEKEDILRRIGFVAQELDLGSLLGRNIFQLSGGERQRIACAAASTIDPSLYVLDEPSSNLDMAGIGHLRRAIERWKATGKTILIAEHRIFYLRELVDCMVLMKDGRVAKTFTGDKFRSMSNADLRKMGLRAAVLRETGQGNTGKDVARTSANTPSEVIAQDDFPVVIENLCFSYQRSKEPALAINRLILPRHGIVALIGKNGAGKSTFSLCLAGLMRHSKACLSIDGKVYKGSRIADISYVVMQDVHHQLFAEDVLDEILLSMKEPRTEKAQSILSALHLDGLEKRHPLSLSGGQKQRVAIAAALAAERNLVIYDEPTSGLDLRHMEEVASVMRDMHKQGVMQIVVTHDPELVEACCTHAVELDNGHAGEAYSLDQEGLHRMYAFFDQMTSERL